MGRQRRGKSQNNNSNNADFAKEEKLQAVLLADSFRVKLRPITAEKPKVSSDPDPSVFYV